MAGASMFKASLILVPGFRDLVFPTHGWPAYVVAPARDFVYVIPADDKYFLARLGTVVLREHAESAYPLSPDVLEIGDGARRASALLAKKRLTVVSGTATWS